MNSLQISLIVLAIIAVGAILFYNWLQERKYRKQWTATFGHQEDALLQSSGDRVDPVVHDPVFAVPSAEELLEPVDTELNTTLAASPEATLNAASDQPADMIEEDSFAIEQAPAELLPAPVDSLLDFTIEMHTVDAIPSAAFVPLMDSQRADGRTVRWWGYDNNFAGWIEISPWREQAFTDVVIAIQLADRSGAVSDRQLMNLSREARLLATSFNGVASWNDISAVLVKAKELDQFCVEVDVLIGLNVVSPDGITFGGTKIAEMAQMGNMRLNDAGVYQRLNDRGDVVYSMCNHEDTPFSVDFMATLTTHGITLLFEVPRVDNGVEMFTDMAKFGFQLARALDGKLVDDNIRVLSEVGIEKIQAQLVQIYQQMDAREISAGSQRALRLFN
ncbi:MAG: cell division protein ZipA [Sulfuriferula sp.]